jgi:hypothetical protein
MLQKQTLHMARYILVTTAALLVMQNPAIPNDKIPLDMSISPLSSAQSVRYSSTNFGRDKRFARVYTDFF